MNKFIFVIFVLFGLIVYMLNNNGDKTYKENYYEDNYIKGIPSIKSNTPSVRMYNAIEKYADSFNIPKRIAYGVAKSESGYDGVFDFNYNPYVGSSAGACGAMQVMLSTAKSVNKDKTVTREKLTYNIEYNVMTSMKVLRRLHKKYGNWKTALGCYNTGKPCVNGYAIKVYNHKINWKLKKLNY